MQCAYKVMADGAVILHSAEIINFWTELDQKTYKGLMESHKKGEIIYQDKKGKLCTRHRHTIWDEKKQIYVEDKQAILNEISDKNKNDANVLYNAGLLDRHQYNKLTEKQQKELDKYLDDLYSIKSNKEILSDEIKLPKKPAFLD